MKKFMMLVSALLLTFNVYAAVESSYSVVINTLGYEGSKLIVETQSNLSTGCDVNDSTNTFYVENSSIQKVVAGITMSAHQDRNQAILYYEAGSCDPVLGVNVVGAALRAQPENPDAPSYGADYGLIETKFLNNKTEYVNQTETAQRVIITGRTNDEGLYSLADDCKYVYNLKGNGVVHSFPFTDVGTEGNCNNSQMSFNLAKGMSVSVDNLLDPEAKSEILVFGVTP